MLELKNITAGYSDVTILREVSLIVPEGQIVALIGANGAGKTTTLRTISGLLRPSKGTINFGDELIHTLATHKIVDSGLIQVPEGRHLFPKMSVLENLELGSFRRGKSKRSETLEKVLAMFPRLDERRDQLAGTLSGGEQQMLAIGRALMTLPKLLMLDEPSLGLAPLIVQDIFRIVQEIRATGTTVLIVEQNAVQTLSIADHAYVMENGKIVLQGTGDELLEDAQIRTAYLGL
ncbi:MAG: ATP-binding cassette domain-containing protein [Chloroflexi bacterium]|nr:ATP-binding cassette domain-containing protein [Chloroflexota bacterium]